MPRHEYRTVDVFTSERFAGNPLAVFPEGDAVPPQLMQRIASELNLSETTFVTRTSRADCDVRVRIFTPKDELPMAGHPTLGTAFVLDRPGPLTFEEGVGPIPIEREPLPGGGVRFWMQQPAPRFTPISDDRVAVARALALEAGDLAELPIEIGSSAMPFVYVPLANLDALARARLNQVDFERLACGQKIPEVYLFVVTGRASVRARMFAPALGVAEDPATGGACGPLGGYLLRHERISPGERITCQQGHEMGRPSTISIEVPGPGQPVRVGGTCVAVGGGYIDL